MIDDKIEFSVDIPDCVTTAEIYSSGALLAKNSDVTNEVITRSLGGKRRVELLLLSSPVIIKLPERLRKLGETLLPRSRARYFDN